MPRLAVVAVAGLALCACSSLIPIGSGGGRVRTADPAESQRDSFTWGWEYTNWIEFQGDLTISIDSVFARYDGEDRDIIDAVQDFATPAQRVFSENLGIDLSGRVLADSGSRKFTLHQSPLDWSRGRQLASSHPMIGLLSRKDADAVYRWKAEILYAEVSFNALTPRRVFVRAKLSTEMHRFKRDENRWVAVLFDRGAVDRMGQTLRKKLRNAYYQYLNDRYGFKVTSSRFGGFNEQ